jgi:mannose-6-phosphate isomerase
MTDEQLYPLLLRGELKDVIWGGQALGALLGKSLPAGATVGESWEVHDTARVVNGALAGTSLHVLFQGMGEWLIGSALRQANLPGILPLLIKFIDANQTLSVQVHPDDDYARAHEAQRPYHNGKTEAWYIIAASPEGAVYHGWRQRTTAAAVRQAVEEGRLEGLLVRVPVRAGDVVFVPAGTVHAIGAGVLLYEVQENSDITYRLYDWNRTDASGQPRELHLEQSLAVLDYSAGHHAIRHGLPVEMAAGQRTLLIACRYFLLERLTLTAPHEETLHGDTFHALSLLEGEATIALPGAEPLPASRGDTILIPAAGRGYTIIPASRAVLLRSSIPDRQRDVVVPLREAGYDSAAIATVWPGG